MDLKQAKMKQKKPFPNLKEKASTSVPEAPKSPLPRNPQLRNKASVPILKDKTSVPRLKNRSASTSVPKMPKPLRLPLSPGTPSSTRDVSGPRFMSMSQAEGIKPTEYRPRTKSGPLKMPTIMGVTPTRLKQKVVEVKRESRPTRIMKALKNPDMMKVKWKGTIKNFMRMRMMKRLNGCMRAFHTEATVQEEMQIEYKPIYRLKEIKRASIMLGLQKPKRPVSLASVDSSSTVKGRRFSTASSIYSRRPLSTAEAPETSPSDSQRVDFEDNPALRASLLPYQEWWAFMQATQNPFMEDSLNDEDACFDGDAPATPIHRPHCHNSHRNSALFPFPQRNSFKPLTLFDPASDDTLSTPPSPTSSEVTITPTRFHFMSEESKAYPQGPAADLGAKRDEVASGAQNKETEIANDSEHNPQTQQDHASTMEVSKLGVSQKATPKNCSVSDDIQTKAKRNDKEGDRIPRGTSQKSYPGVLKGPRSTPDHRSAIPVAARRLSGENVDTTKSPTNEGFAGGIRVLDKPSGPRPRPAAAELTTPSVPEPIRETEKESGNSSSSSSISSWDLEDGQDGLQKPPTVFTGEYRTRLSERQHRYGPTLKIAGSAENVIMGNEDHFRSSIVTQRSSPLRVKYIDRMKPNSPQDPGDAPKSQNDQVPGQNSEQQPQAKKFCRPQISLESIPKKDISNRELSMARKPLNRPSLASLFVGSAEDLDPEGTPPVPKVSISKDGSVHKASPLSLSEMEKGYNSTPTPSPRQNEETPEPVQKNMGPLRSHPPPPRSSSLKAVTDFPMNPDSDSDPKSSGEMPTDEKDGTHLKRDVTFDDFAETRASKDQGSAEVPRLPDSKSNRMFDSFRNMFKHKGATERGRTKKEESDQTPMFPREQSTVNIKSMKNADEKTESTKLAPKGKAKYPKLSDSVGWNKASRNPKTSGEFSPVFIPTPTSTLSASFPTPLTRNTPDDRTPSFARPTKSTRTKTTFGSNQKPQVSSAGPEGRQRRIIQGVTASTGSPQRPTRVGTKRPSVVPTTQRPTISQPCVIAPNNNQENIAPGGVKQSEPVQRSFKEIRSCIETLCNKARDEGTAIKREKYLRLALSLQQQLSDFQGVEKEAEEAQLMFNSKKSDKNEAESTLFQYFKQVQVQLDEEE